MFQGGRDISYRYGGPVRRVTAPHAGCPASQGLPRGTSTSPLSIPQARGRRVRDRPVGRQVPPMRPKRRPRHQRFGYSASPLGGCLLLLSDRSSNLPAAHRAHPAPLGTSPQRKPRISDAVSNTQVAEAKARRGPGYRERRRKVWHAYVGRSSTQLRDRGDLAVAADKVWDKTVRGCLVKPSSPPTAAPVSSTQRSENL